VAEMLTDLTGGVSHKLDLSEGLGMVAAASGVRGDKAVQQST